MFYGAFPMPWWGYLVVGLICVQITILAVTLYLHRAQAHRALELHPAICHFFRLWLWLTTGMTTRAWASIHRKHHAKVETAEDPHSPQVSGIKTVLWHGAELYRREAANPETLKRYGYGTPNDTLENIYENYSNVGIYITLILNMILFGVPGITLWAVQMMWIPFFAAGVINGIGHYWGYRNFECDDASTNISPWGLWIGGEELHNNHHTYPTSAKFSIQWWEVDIGWGVIQILRFFKLAKVKKIAPQITWKQTKENIDADSVKGLIINRFNILAKYTKQVLLPTLNDAGLSSEEVRNFKQPLIAAKSLVSEKDATKLQQFLEKYPKLQAAYQLRNGLQAIWQHTSATQKELIESFENWCKQAENAGISTLKQFSLDLRKLHATH